MTPTGMCPFVGLADDPRTAVQFPSEGNHCHHGSRAAPIDRQHQQMFCLSPDFTACPVYRNLKMAPPPPNTAVAPIDRSAVTRKLVLATVLLALLLVSSVVTVFAWWNGWGPFNGSGLLANASGSAGRDISGLPGVLVFGQATPGPATTHTAPALIPQTGSQNPVANCPMPAGWTVYDVKPTDSLHLLGLLYRIDVARLRQANCLKPDDFIRPGQKLYVPLLPTETPTATATRTPVVVVVIPTELPTDEPQPYQTPIIPSATWTWMPTLMPTWTPTPPSATVTPFPTLPRTVTPKPTATPEPTRTRRPRWPTRTPGGATATPTTNPIIPSATPAENQSPTSISIYPTLPPTDIPNDTPTPFPTQPVVADNATPTTSDPSLIQAIINALNGLFGN